MTTEDKKDLHEISAQLTYQAILFSRLNGVLTNSQWDAKAEELAHKVDAYLDGLITEEFQKIEVAAEQAAEHQEAA